MRAIPTDSTIPLSIDVVPLWYGIACTVPRFKKNTNSPRMNLEYLVQEQGVAVLIVIDAEFFQVILDEQLL